jgi:hypothetical protein
MSKTRSARQRHASHVTKARSPSWRRHKWHPKRGNSRKRETPQLPWAAKTLCRITNLRPSFVILYLNCNALVFLKFKTLKLRVELVEVLHCGKRNLSYSFIWCGMPQLTDIQASRSEHDFCFKKPKAFWRVFRTQDEGISSSSEAKYIYVC